MTRQRRFPEDEAFGTWLRAQEDIPSSSYERGHVADNVDWLFQQYKTPVDGQGERRINAFMIVETKTRGGEVPFHQRDTLGAFHQKLTSGKPIKRYNGKGELERIERFFGAFVLQMSGTDPENSKWMRWGRFNVLREIDYRYVDVETLKSLLLFDRHPSTFEKQTFRRHHIKKKVIRRGETELGFGYDDHAWHRS